MRKPHERSMRKDAMDLSTCVQFSRCSRADGADGRQDDMLVCVPAGVKAAAAMPAVRLPALGLPEQVAYGTPLYRQTDWRRTCYLNVALQSEYRLTLVGTRCAIW